MSENIPEFWRYKLCKWMGWDYYQYEMTPPRFRQECVIFMLQELQANVPMPPDEDEKRRIASLPPEQREVKVVGLQRG